MKILKIITSIFVILCFFQTANACEKVVRVIDGDTIETEKTGIIRILGIDSFDKNPKYVKQQIIRTGLSKEVILSLREDGRIFAENTLLNQCVDLKYDGLQKDIFNRTLAYIEINEKDYGTLLLLETAEIVIYNGKNTAKRIQVNLANVYCKQKKIKRFKYYNQISQFQCH
jgi:endonuclease YncB( thermonuclease family)